MTTKIECVDNELSDDPLGVNHHHQSSNRSTNNNNGHCIRTDSNASNNDTDDEMVHVSHISEVHHRQSSPPMKMCGVGLPEATDAAHVADVIMNADGSDGFGADDNISKQQHDTSEIQSETTASDISETVIVTAATAPPIETDPNVDESLDVSKKQTSPDGINGPANDVRV